MRKKIEEKHEYTNEDYENTIYKLMKETVLRLMLVRSFSFSAQMALF